MTGLCCREVNHRRDCDGTISLEFVFRPEPAFQAGDVVELKSGGRRMTVENATEHYASFVWHTVEGEPQHFTFRSTSLSHSE